MISMCLSAMPKGVVHRQTARWSLCDSHISDAQRRFTEITAMVSLSHSPVCLIRQKSKALLNLEQSIRFEDDFMRSDDGDLRLLVETIRSLRKAVLGLQQQAEALSEQLTSVDTEVSLRLSAAIEEVECLRCRVDPYSSDGGSLADLSEF